MISGLDEGLHYHLSWLNWSEQKRLFELKTSLCHSSHFLPWLLEQTPSCNYNSIGGGGGVIINPLCSTSARFNENKAGGGALFEWYDQMQLCGLWRAVRKKKWNRRDCWPRLFLIRADQYPLVSGHLSLSFLLLISIPSPRRHQDDDESFSLKAARQPPVSKTILAARRILFVSVLQSD